MQISVRVYELSCVGEYLLITAKPCGLVNMALGLLLNQWALVISIVIFRTVTPDNNQPIVIL